MSNVEIVVEDEPPDGRPLLGLYRGVPLPRRSSTYGGVLDNGQDLASVSKSSED
jgi:predicted Zn-dependent protease with MMP-like domain